MYDGTYSVKAPMICGCCADEANSRQAKAFWSMQLQAVSEGVGGSCEDASSDPFDAGQLIVEAVTLDLAGVLGGLMALYCVDRRLKSSPVTTLDVSTPST